MPETLTAATPSAALHIRTPAQPAHVRDVLGELSEMVLQQDGRMFATGSRVIGGWTEESDWDYVVYVRDSYGMQRVMQRSYGWTHGGSDVSSSWKKGGVNAIFVFSDLEFLQWQAATMGAKALGLTARPERVAFFEAIKHGGSHVLANLIAMRGRPSETTISEGEGPEPTEVGYEPDTFQLSHPIF